MERLLPSPAVDSSELGYEVLEDLLPARGICGTGPDVPEGLERSSALARGLAGGLCLGFG